MTHYVMYLNESNRERTREDLEVSSAGVKFDKARPFASYFDSRNFVVLIPAPRKGAINTNIYGNTVTVTYKYEPPPIPADCTIHESNTEIQELVIITLPPETQVRHESPDIDTTILNSTGYFKLLFPLFTIQRQASIHF